MTLFTQLIDFTANFSFWQLAVCMVVSIIGALLLYNHRKQRILFIIRLLILFCTLLLLLSIKLNWIQYFNQKPILIFAQDNSASLLNNKDSLYISHKYKTELAKFKNSLNEKYNLQFCQFSDKIRFNDSLNFKGNSTNISQVFDWITREFKLESIAGLIIATDGNYNQGTNPIYRIQNLDFPIHTISFGDTVIEKDAFFTEVKNNATVNLGDLFPLEISIKVYKAKGEKLILTVMQENEKPLQFDAQITDNEYNKTFQIQLEAKKIGTKKIHLSIKHLNAEKVFINNEKDIFINILDTKQHILLLYNEPDPDISTIVNSIKRINNYEIETAFKDDCPIQIDKFNLIIMHHINIESGLTHQFQTQGKPILFIKQISSNARELEVEYNGLFSLFDVPKPLQTLLQNEVVHISDNNQKKSKLNSNQIIKIKQTGKQDENLSIYEFNELNGIKSGTIQGILLWKWALAFFRLSGNHFAFDELFNKTIQYLISKDDKSHFSLFFQPIVNENQPIEFSAIVLDPSFAFTNKADVDLKITTENKNVYTYHFNSSEKSYNLNLGVLPSGNYRFEATSKSLFGTYTKKGEFIITPLDNEKLDTKANFTLFYAMSNKNNGTINSHRQLEKLATHLLNDRHLKSIVNEERETVELINSKYLFFLLLVLLSIEWVLRKQNGWI